MLATFFAGLTFGAGGMAVRPDTFTTAEEIKAAQDAHFERTGTFFLSTEGKNPRQEIGKNLPDGYQLYTYIKPNGERGWWLEYTDEETFYSIGYGPDASDRTYARKLPSTAASSSPK